MQWSDVVQIKLNGANDKPQSEVHSAPTQPGKYARKHLYKHAHGVIVASGKQPLNTNLSFIQCLEPGVHESHLTASIPPWRVPKEVTLRSTSLAAGTFLKCTSKISLRPFTSGLGTVTCRSKRPGRTRALSKDCGKLVAAMQMTPSLGLNLQNPNTGDRQHLDLPHDHSSTASQLVLCLIDTGHDRT